MRVKITPSKASIKTLLPRMSLREDVVTIVGVAPQNIIDRVPYVKVRVPITLLKLRRPPCRVRVKGVARQSITDKAGVQYGARV